MTTNWRPVVPPADGIIKSIREPNTLPPLGQGPIPGWIAPKDKLPDLPDTSEKPDPLDG